MSTGPIKVVTTSNIEVTNTKIAGRDKTDSGFGTLAWKSNGAQETVKYAQVNSSYNPIYDLFVKIGEEMGWIHTVEINDGSNTPLSIRVWTSDYLKLDEIGAISQNKTSSVGANVLSNRKESVDSKDFLPKEPYPQAFVGNLKKHSNLLKSSEWETETQLNYMLHNVIFYGESKDGKASIISDGSSFFKIPTEELRSLLNGRSNDLACEKIIAQRKMILTSFTYEKGIIHINLCGTQANLTFTPNKK